MVPLAYAAGLSLLVGSISAMRQTKIKRLLALSGVANGLVLLALVVSMGSYSASFNRLYYLLRCSVYL
jgi:NADH:ubiquinone oxidoreductase subunit 2 (subunit N)